MIPTSHIVRFADSRSLDFLEARSIALVVTSPPYPMIEMWDGCFSSLNRDIRTALQEGEGPRAFELMHGELDRTWVEVHRVLVDGGIACINVGDATRKLGKAFRLYANHVRMLRTCMEIGFDVLPLILWRKTTNAPNKFMGSGMLPAAAYVTLEHEYILVLRKGDKRSFSTPEEKQNRRESGFFWEERNTWFSDVWDPRGTRQSLNLGRTRDRSAAFPFELAYRLVNMFSVKGDTVLDPFLGTGTTMRAAAASERNSVGVEIDEGFYDHLSETTPGAVETLNAYVSERLRRHLRFVEEYAERRGRPKYVNAPHGFPVVTSQETDLTLRYIDRVEELARDPLSYRISYRDAPAGSEPEPPVGPFRAGSFNPP
jgi:DNA modification methylase